jgi:UDP-3-O-[3-hydroxymyristoyl] glucosamine N-acyltransferase
VIGDDVEIGANSTIDRSRFEKHRRRRGHEDRQPGPDRPQRRDRQALPDLRPGRHRGELTLGDYVVLGGQAGLAGHLTVGTGAMVAAQSGVKDDIPPKTSVFGTPSLPDPARAAS